MITNPEHQNQGDAFSRMPKESPALKEMETQIYLDEIVQTKRSAELDKEGKVFRK